MYTLSRLKRKNTKINVNIVQIRATQLEYILDVTYHTRETVFHRDIQTSRRGGLKKDDAQRSIFDEIRGIWTANETLTQVFKISLDRNGKN